MMKKFILFLILPWFLFSNSIVLLNDSPFELTAIVQAANGIFIGQITLQPGEQNTFVADFKRTELDIPETPDVSLTPYIVLWRCPYEGYYSTNTNVSPGALTRASDGEGTKYCAPKPKK